MTKGGNFTSVQTRKCDVQMKGITTFSFLLIEIQQYLEM